MYKISINKLINSYQKKVVKPCEIYIKTYWFIISRNCDSKKALNAISVDIFKMILKVYIKRKNLMVLLQSWSLNAMLSKTEDFLNLKPNRPLKD